MMWNEWECPWCHRIGECDPGIEYAPGDVVRMACPTCGKLVEVEACETVELVAHRPQVKCVLTVEYEGYPCNDYRCSNCNKIHNAPRAGNFCPRCGACVMKVRKKGKSGKPGRPRK